MARGQRNSTSPKPIVNFTTENARVTLKRLCLTPALHSGEGTPASFAWITV